MKVKELIKILQKEDPEKDILFNNEILDEFFCDDETEKYVWFEFYTIQS